MSNDLINMEAGRELDIAIAEKVMGLVVIVEDDGYAFYLDSGSSSVRADECLIPDYSTNIKNAWEVVEKIEEITSFYMHSSKTVVLHSFLNGPMISGETTPHAVCLAALKAVGVRND